MISIPLKDSLRTLLSIEGLFSAMLNYMDRLYEEKELLTNIIQGKLWKKKLASFDKKGFVIPLIGYYDDIETGNALSGHAGKNKLGAVYTFLPSLPPSYASKLESIILTSLFYSNDRKDYGNNAVFRNDIDALNDLRENGITIVHKNKAVPVYFITILL